MSSSIRERARAIFRVFSRAHYARVSWKSIVEPTMNLRDRLEKIRAEFQRMTADLRGNSDLPPPGEMISTVTECNEARSALIEFDIALRVRHRERQPWTPPPLDLSPQPALDPQTRAEIDATP